jgi:hypothetical protein
MSNIALASIGRSVIQPGSEDPFEITFRPALPVLDAVIEVWKMLRWFNKERPVHLDPEDADHAAKLVASIPDEGRLIELKKLFWEAEFTPAPESWTHVAIGAMLESYPEAANISDAFRCAIVDSAFRDPCVWDGYEPGFSYATIVRAIRHARLKGVLLPAGDFIKLCRQHRAQFRRWRADIEDLVGLRDQAKTILIGPDHPDWTPF